MKKTLVICATAIICSALLSASVYLYGMKREETVTPTEAPQSQQYISLGRDADDNITVLDTKNSVVYMIRGSNLSKSFILFKAELERAKYAEIK